MPPAFEEAAKRFESWLRVEKNLSPRTRKAYLYDLRRFGDFVRERQGGNKLPALSKVEKEAISEYLIHLREDLGYRATTLSRSISSIRVFFDFCVEQGWLEESPAHGISTPKRPRKLPVYLIEKELRALFDAPDLTTQQGVRDRAMLIAMAFCGLRLQELVGLSLGDIDFESRTIRVLGKGSKERLIPMNRDVDRALRAWLDQRNCEEKERAIFTNRFGRRMSGRMVEKIVDKYVKAAGLSKSKLSPHKLRHTFATMLHQKDVDLVEIQALLGHAAISTTQIYTHTNRQRLRGAVDRINHLAE